MSVSFQCLSILFGPYSLASGGSYLTGAAASGGMDSLAVMLLSVCSESGGPSSLILGGDSLIGSIGRSKLDHLWASSIDLKGTFLKSAVVLVMELPSGLLAITLACKQALRKGFLLSNS